MQQVFASTHQPEVDTAAVQVDTDDLTTLLTDDADADSLTTARKAFKELSVKAVALARGQPGYFIAHCSMFPV